MCVWGGGGTVLYYGCQGVLVRESPTVCIAVGSVCVGQGLVYPTPLWQSKGISSSPSCCCCSNRAECYLQTNQPRKAIKDCNRALAMNPFNMKVRSQSCFEGMLNIVFQLYTYLKF